MDKVLYNTLLFDFYSGLLTKKQRDICRMYFCEDLSLAEIGEKLGISRQAVNFSIKNAKQNLTGYEEVLRLVEQHRLAQNHVVALEEALERQDFVESKKILTELGNMV